MPDHHPTKRVHVGPWAADIDVLIAPLIRDIWKAGIETRQCCQSYAWLGVKGRRIWVQFPGSVELAKFLNAVTHDRDACGALYYRVCWHWILFDRPGRRWQYRIHYFDRSVANEFNPDGGWAFEGPPDFVEGVDVFFPKSDLALVLKELRRYNRVYRRGGAPAVR